MERLREDVRFALRSLAKSPGFTAVAVATLALGIGANTALFGWVRALLLAPLPGVPGADGVVAIETRTPAGTRIDSSWADYDDLRREARSFSGLVAFQQRHVAFSPRNEPPRRLHALFVSGNYFDVLGVAAVRGRTFTPEDGRVPGGAPVAVIGDGFWRRQLGGDARAVGRTVRVNDRELTIVGILPPEFKGTINGLNFEMYVPLAAAPLIGGEVGGDRARLEGNRTNRWLDIMGRLRPAADRAAAQAELDTVAARLAADNPDSNRGMSFVVEPIAKATYGAPARLGSVVVALFAAVGLTLLIACANLANLLLVRAAGRRREIAVRLALGATRGRLVRQLVTEGVVLAILGGAAGLLVVPQVNALVGGFLPASIPLPLDLAPPLDRAVFAFAFALSLATGVLAGLLPALQASRPDVRESLQEGSAGAGLGPQPQRLRRLLVLAQLALGVVLLTATGLFLVSLRKAARLDLGFDQTGVLLVGFDFPASLGRAEAVPFYRRVLERVAAVPGVVAASYGNHAPLWLEGGDWEEIRVAGYAPRADENMKIDVVITWPGYFGLMRMPFVAGRDFRDSDDASSARVAVVNQAFGARYLAGRDPVGAKMWIGDQQTTIVGVVRTARYRRLLEEPSPLVYVPHLQYLPPGTALHVRVAPGIPPGALLSRVRAEVQRVDPRVATVGMPLAEATATALLPQTIGARLLGALGGLALALAALGVYGITAHSVSRRRREIGIRVTLGARPAEVRRLVFREGALLTGAGVAGGLVAAVATTRLLASLLIEVGPADPAVLLSVAAVLGASALLATWIPARRAARLDPVDALRAE